MSRKLKNRVSSIRCQVSGKKLDALDRRILNRLQGDIPYDVRPWEIIARELNIESAVLLKRVAFLKKKGIIRRMAAVFNPAKVGFSSTLVATKVAPVNIGAAVKKINSYPEVTHNYERLAEYNIWFTLVAQSKKRIVQILNELKKEKRIEKLINLPAVRLFKIDVNFKV